MFTLGRCRSIGLALVFAAVSCARATPPPAPQEAPAVAPPAGTPVDSTTAGAITGRIVFKGPRPRPATINMASDPACTAGGTAARPSDAVLVSADGALQNAFVFIQDGLDRAYTFQPPTKPVVLDQKGCRYVPRVAGAQVGQPVDVVNDDPTFHNVHGIATRNQEFNRPQPSQFMRERRIFTAPETMVHLKCDVHNWMDAYIGVLPHPFFAVTPADGTFTLRGVPPGTYTVEAWHETLGVRTAQVTLAPRQTADASFTFGG
jgi:hypothetical protein